MPWGFGNSPTVVTDSVERRHDRRPIIVAFEGGAAAEEIVMRFPTLRLADVYAVIAYYLRHKAEVQDYMRWRDREAEEVLLNRSKIAVQKDDV